ncbi:hypothetical protein GCM10023081_08110 [Arthrobacter ginkgonis]|uniref:Uncharacterized protein n=1 Tax=Arthrobacter ginkgonis TaxID=1630594 RepID=A0ABP7BWT8_9MICC
MTTDGQDPGKELYEERAKLLPGLWMPDALPWESLSEEAKERWRRTAAQDGPRG